MTDIYEVLPIADRIRGNRYVGRGIVIGKSANGKYACSAYFIMGRSANSRNRIFVERDGVLYTEPYDVSRVEDPSLIIYAAQHRYGNRLIVTNGDQTDTIYEGLCAEKTFSEQDFRYEMSILKSADAAGSACNRYTFSFAALPGLGHFLHTYVCDGNPLPTFQGEPERVSVPDDIDAFTASLWDALDAENRISLYVRYTNLETGAEENRLINQNR